MPAPIPSGYPLPAGERLTEQARLGRKASFVFEYNRAGAAVLDDLAAALEAADWPVERNGDTITTRRDGLEVVARAADRQVIVDAITAAPAADARPPRPPPLETPPPGWLPGFPFIPGAIPETVRGAPAGAFGLVYPNKTAAQMAAALRGDAERRRWMCTQEPLKFVCAAGRRSVEIRLSDRRGEAVLLVIVSGLP